jgi:thioredoxin 1
MKNTKKIFAMTAVFMLFLAAVVFSIAPGKAKKNTHKITAKPEATFIELGSVNCIPCKAMQLVMKEIEKEYAGKVKVIFYDVWTEEGRPYAGKYKIRVIPTQVFLDKDGKEFYRHEGFFPKEEIAKILQEQGVK